MILRVLLALLLLFTPSAFAQTGRPPVVVETVADAMARGARPGEELIVRNYSSSRLWASPRQFTAQSSTNAHDGVHYLTNMTAGLIYVSQDRFASQQDVRWFGAIMTNTVDSSAAIQAAINYGADDDFYPATGRRGITVSIPAGELLVTNSIQLKAGTRLVGAGHENTVIFTAITNADTIYYNDTVAGISVVPEVSSLAINQTTNAVPTSGAGIHFYATLPGTSVSPVVRDVLIRRTYRGIVIDTAFQGLLDHVRAFSCVDDGFRIEQSADGIDSTSTTFLSCYAAANGGDGYDLIGSYHTLLGCASDSNSGYGYRGNRSAAGYTLSNVSFNSCGAEANTLGGYYLLGAFATRIEGTVYGVAGNGHGITLDSGSGITISGRISSISVTNKWAVYMTNNLGYYPAKVSILTDEIGSWGEGRVSHPELVAYLSDSWKGPYPSVVYGTKPTALPAGLTLAPTLGGDGTYNLGTYNTPYFSTNASGFTAVDYVVPRFGWAGSQTLFASRIVTPPLVTSGTTSYLIGDWYQTTTNGTSSDVAIWIGNSYPAAQDFSIAVTSTNEARFAGLLSATTVRSTDASANTKAELTTGGVVRGPFFETTATNLSSTQKILNIGSGTRFTDDSTVQVAANYDLWFATTNTTATQYGVELSYRANPVTQIGTTYGIHMSGYAQTTGYVAALYGIGQEFNLTGGGGIGTAAGTVIFTPTLSGGTRLTNFFGLLIQDQDKATNNHAIYTGLGKVRFGDDLTIATGKGITLGGVYNTTWPSGFSFSDLTNALLMGSNMSAVYTSTNMTISSSGGGGATNGTPVSVDGGATLSAANFADGSRVGFSASGTNVTADIVANSIRTNELATAAVSYLLDRGNHTGTQNWSTITGTPTTLSGYGITDAQPLDDDLTRIANVTWALGDIVYRDATGLTNFATTAAGRALMNAVDAAAQRTALSITNYQGGVGVQLTGTNFSHNIAAGTNVTLTTNGNQLVINATSSSSGTAVLVNGTNVSNPNFRRFFGITDSTNVDLLLAAGTNVTFTTNSGALMINATAGTSTTTNYLTVPIFTLSATNTVANNNTTETNIITSISSWGSTNIGANTLTAGSTLRLRIGGKFTATGDWTGGTLKYKVGNSFVVSSTFSDTDSLVPSNAPWQFDVDLLVVSAGASSTTVVSGGLLHYYTSAGTFTSTAYQPLTVSGTLDTTAGNNVSVTFQNAVGQEITLVCNTATLEWVGKQTILGGGSGSSGGGTTNLVSVSTNGLAPQITSSNAVLTSSATGVPTWVPNRMTKTLARFRAIQGEPPASNYGVFSTRNNLGVMTFHESVNEALRFRWIVPEGTTATNVTVRITWTTSATSGDGRWGARNWRLTGDLDSDDFATAVEGTTTTSGTAGTKMVTTLPAVGLDGAVAGDEVATEVYRDSSDGADTINLNRLELHSVEVLAE